MHAFIGLRDHWAERLRPASGIAGCAFAFRSSRAILSCGGRHTWLMAGRQASAPGGLRYILSALSFAGGVCRLLNLTRLKRRPLAQTSIPRGCNNILRYMEMCGLPDFIQKIAGRDPRRKPVKVSFARASLHQNGSFGLQSVRNHRRFRTPRHADYPLRAAQKIRLLLRTRHSDLPMNGPCRVPTP